MPSENQTQPNPGQDSQDCEVASHARQARGSRVIQRRTASHLLRCEQPGSFSSASWRDRNQSLPVDGDPLRRPLFESDRKSTPLNSSHSPISYAVFCLQKKKKQ